MRVYKIIAAAAVAILLAGCSNARAAVLAGAPASLPAPAASVTKTPAAYVTPVLTASPEPTRDPYFTDDERVAKDEENGCWLYTSPTLYVKVSRVFDEDKMLTYFAADIRVKPGETERGGFSTPKKPGGKSSALYKIAQYYKAVIAVNGDFLDHHASDPKGVIIRDGIVFADDDENSTLAFMPDGTLRIFEAGEATADGLLAQGVTNAFSFGPVLIKDGAIQPVKASEYVMMTHPRTGVGMIGPYHYLLIVADGRDNYYSLGLKLDEFAELFASYGCSVAYNLDGGASSTMAFMGENINQYMHSHTGQRYVPDALMFGTSALVATDWP